jgi:regulator of protease activity HflC (stomatin/prohibitin superfamily)
MDPGVALLLTVIMIVVVIAIITTGIHIVKPGEIGFLYRGRKCLRHFGPAFVFSTPIVSKMYKVKTESFHILFEPPNPRIEALLEIANPSRVPIAVKDLDSEIRNLASDTVRGRFTQMNAAMNRADFVVDAEELTLRLNKSFEKMGLRVSSVKVGEHEYTSPIDELAGAKILNWDDFSRRLRS